MSTRTPILRRLGRSREQGFSLIETLVAMLIGLFLLSGAVTVFMIGRNTSRTGDAVSRMQENLRYALDTIEPDIRMANYWGMTNRSDLLTGVALPAATQTAIDLGVTGNCGVNYTANLTQFIDGRDNAYGLACAAVNYAANTDVLITRRASANQTAALAGKLQIQTTRIGGQIFVNGVVPAGYGAAPLSETHDLFVNAYYIGQVLPSPSGNPQWALHRQTLGSGGATGAIADQVIVTGITDLQVQFGLDTDNDNSADVYVNPGSALLATGRVVSVKLWLLGEADDPEQDYTNTTTYTLGNRVDGPYNDKRRRMLISKTISVRNAQAP